MISQQRLETRSLKKKYIIAFFILGLILSCLLCLAQNATIITKPTVNVAKVMPLIITKGGEQELMNVESNNVFYVHFPVGIINPLVAQNTHSDLLTSRIVITDVTVTNVFGGSIELHHLKTSTRILDFINISHFLNVNLNNDNFHQLSVAAATCYFLLIGVIFAALSLLFLFVFDNLFNLLCLGWLKLVRRQSANTFQFIIINIVFFITLLLSVIICFVGVLHTDDGFFNLMAKYPSDVLSGLPSTYYTITSLILRSVGDSLILFRLITIILSLFSVAVVSISFFQLMKSALNLKCNNKLMYVIVVLLAIVNDFQYLHHVTPDYNNLSRVVVYLQVAIILTLFNKFVSHKTYIWCLALGVITGLNIFIKAPEAMASSAVIIFLLWWIDKNYIRKLISFASGLLFSMLFYFSFIQPWHSWLRLLHSSIHYGNLLGGHQAQLLLVQNFKDIFYFVGQCLLMLVFYHWLIRSLINKEYPRRYVTAFVIFLVLLITASNLFHMPRQFDLFKFFVPLGKAFLLVFLIILYENVISYRKLNQARKMQFRSVSLVSLLLLVFTYIASVGTDTPIFYHIIFHPCLIVMAIILQWWLLDSSEDSQLLILFVLIFTSGVIFIKGAVYNSAMYTNLLQQTVRYNIAGEPVYISASANEGLGNMKLLLQKCGYKDGDYISGYYTMPDIIFALGARSPVTPWYSNSNDNLKTLKANQYINSLMPTLEQRRSFLLVDTSQDLASIGVNFQHDTINCGSVNFDSLSDFKIKHIAIFRRY